MTPIGDDGRKARVVRPAIVRCLEPECGREFEERASEFMGFRFPTFCPECRNKKVIDFNLHEAAVKARSKAYRRQEWWRAQIPQRFWEKTLDSFDPSDGQNAAKVEAFRKYVETFPMDRSPHGFPSLLITRDVKGVGKTHLACGILREIIDRHPDPVSEGSPFQFWPAMSIKVRLQAAQRFSSTETTEQVYNHLSRVRLLVIDDVGQEMVGSEYDSTFLKEMYFGIVNGRYNNNLPMVITANLGFTPWEGSNITLTDLMGSAAVSRLMEMTGGIQYVVEGLDRR
jgi:DNA replication protein DnaC